ncbi:hypothetical protein [Virgibacillus sp. YIM 98842]|uniref:hypothetical protein n=1 Tax=Virgibacillus sp. YIM 98842 TaxID=2663533 RepID=UPI0013DC317A|nr:hypothetical protein [Virgibacillus sp. YIM 98842]
MSTEEQSRPNSNETSAIENMISEGGLGADIYYIHRTTDKENNKSTPARLGEPK